MWRNPGFGITLMCFSCHVRFILNLPDKSPFVFKVFVVPKFKYLWVVSNGSTASIWSNKHCVSLSFFSNASEMRCNVIWRIVALVWVMEGNDWYSVFVHWIVIVTFYCELKIEVISRSFKRYLIFAQNNVFSIKKRGFVIYLAFSQLFELYCHFIKLVLILDHY